MDSRLRQSNPNMTLELWKKRAEDAESKIIQLEARIQTLVVSIKDLRGRVSHSDNRSSELEETLQSLIERVKSDTSLGKQTTAVQRVHSTQHNEEIKKLKARLFEQEQVIKQKQEEIDTLRTQLAKKQQEEQQQKSSSTSDPNQLDLRAIALFDFAGEKEADLAFKEGEVIIVLKKYLDGWWLGELNGKIGKFPSNFIEEFVPENTAAVALRDFNGEREGDLSFKQDDVIYILKKEEEWYLGELNGVIGWLPKDFVEEVEVIYEQ